MSGYFAKPPLGSKLNRGHPLAASIRRAWLFAESGKPRVWDSVTGNNATYTRTNADTFWKAGSRGRALKMGADGGVATFVPNNGVAIGASSFTVLGGITLGSPNTFLERVGSDGASVLFNNRQSSSDVSPTLYATSTNFRFVADGPSLIAGAQGSIAPVVGTEYCVGGVYLRDTSIATYGGTWQVWLNGVKDGSANSYNIVGSFSGTFSSAVPSLFQRAPGAALQTSEKVAHYLFTWGRALQDYEMEELYVDPFAMFRESLTTYFLPLKKASIPPHLWQSCLGQGVA